VPVLLVLRPLHREQAGKDVYEDAPDPGRHRVCLRRPEVDIEHDHCHADAEGVEDHGKEDKLAEEGDNKGGWGDDLGEEEEEHGEGEEDGDGEGDLLPAVRGEVEHQDGQEGDAHARDDQVHRVEECLPPHCDVEGDVKVWLITAGVVLNVPDGRHLEDVPLDRHVELGQVDPDLHWRSLLIALFEPGSLGARVCLQGAARDPVHVDFML
jgi:hypothetical protein